MHAHVVKEDCIGCGACISECPEVFEMDDDGLAIAVAEEVPEGLEDSAREAADSCPTEAIKIS